MKGCDYVVKNLQVFSEVTYLSENSNKTYMELEMIVSNTDPNLNGVVTTKEFLENRADTLVHMPLQVDKDRLELGLTDSLTHKYDEENDELKTQSIGVITETWLESNEDNPEFVTMKAKARVYKRYKATCDEIVTLYNAGDLKFSWEVSATGVKEENDLIYINEGEFFGHCVVSQPAYPVASATKLVAEAYKEDLCDLCGLELSENEIKGGELTGMEYLKQLLAEMSIDDVRQAIRVKIVEGFAKEDYSYYIFEMFQSYVIVEEWNWELGIQNFYKVDFSIVDGEVVVDVANAIEMEQVWMPKEKIEDNMIISEFSYAKTQREISGLEEQIVTLKSEIENATPEIEVETEDTKTDIDTEIVSEEVEVKEIETEIAEDKNAPTEKEVKLSEEVIKLSEKIDKLKSELESYDILKSEVEAKKLAEQEVINDAKKAELQTKIEKVFSEEEITEDIKTLISEMKENDILVLIAEKFLSSQVEEIIETEEEDIIIEAEESNELNDGQSKKLIDWSN